MGKYLRKKWIILILLILTSAIVLFAVIQNSSNSSTGKQTPHYEAIARVKEWIDGDTVRVKILQVLDPHEGIQPAPDKVRLVGVDTEETIQREAAKEHDEVEEMSQRKYEETSYYEKAIAAIKLARSLAPSGSKIYLDFDDLAQGKGPYRGYFGRIIALVYLKNRDEWINLNARILCEGRLTKSREKLASISSQYDSEFQPISWLSEDYPYN